MIKFDAVDCKQKYEIMKENAEILAERIDKALNFIDNCIGIECKEELRNILKGEDKE